MRRYSDEDIIYSFFCKLMKEYNLDITLGMDMGHDDRKVFIVKDLKNDESDINYETFNSLRRNNGVNR